MRGTFTAIVIAAALLTAVTTIPTPIQAAQNPFEIARAAFKKAQEEAKLKAQEELQRRAGQVPARDQSATPATPATSSTSAQAVPVGAPPPTGQSDATAATAFGPQETARLAAAANFIDIAGLKLGAPLARVEPHLKKLNPKFTFRPLVEIIWPMDVTNTAAQPPANAPKSIRSMQAEVMDGSYTEAWDFAFAVHPNPAVVIMISRTVNYGPGTGPGLDGLLEGVRKKYGPESATDASSMIPDTFQRNFVGRWYFDERGQALRGNLGSQLFRSCHGVGTAVQAGNPGLCGTLTVLDVTILASANGVVNTLVVRVTNHPLEYVAQETAQAYLRQFNEDRAKQQQKNSSQRSGPTL